MGLAKFNVWIRDTQGRVMLNDDASETFDWVGVWRVGEYQQGLNHQPGNGSIHLVKKIPVGLDHIQIEVPPGAYIVQGHFCDPDYLKDNLPNNYTDRVMVIANCDQVCCVNLLLPSYKECIRGTVAAASGAIFSNPDLLSHLPLVLSTICTSAGIDQREVVRTAEMHLNLATKLKVDKQIANANNLINAFEGFEKKR